MEFVLTVKEAKCPAQIIANCWTYIISSTEYTEEINSPHPHLCMNSA